MDKSRILKAAALGAAVLTAISANASVTFSLDSVFAGKPSPTSTSPYLTALFEDTAPNTVKLTLTASLETASEFISDVAFNIKPAIVPSGLTITSLTPANPLVTSITVGAQDAQEVTGGGDPGKGFDIKINWSTSNASSGIRRFNGIDIEELSFSISGLTAADFNYINTGSAGAYMAAHVQGIPGDLSTVVYDKSGFDNTPPVIPEPSTYFAAALLALPVLAQVRKMRKSA